MAQRQRRPDEPEQPPHEPEELLDLDTEDDDDLETPAPPPVEPPPDSKRARQGDQHRPTCPRCSTEDKPVLLVAASSPALFTWYSCPTEGCGHRIKVPRPNIGQLLGRRRADNDAGYSAR
jgi:hypothetical protein